LKDIGKWQNEGEFKDVKKKYWGTPGDCPDCVKNDTLANSDIDYSLPDFDGDTLSIEYTCSCGCEWSESFKVIDEKVKKRPNKLQKRQRKIGDGHQLPPH
jgi:hypothetical protein